MKLREKRFIVKKYVMAVSASQALAREKHIRPDDVWVDEKWLNDNPDSGGVPIGFRLS